MSIRRLRWLAVAGPVVFWVMVLYVRTAFFAEQRSLWGDVFTTGLIGLGAGVFSAWIFRIIDQREEEIRHLYQQAQQAQTLSEQQTQQLMALREASLALSTELDLEVVLQRVVDLSRQLANAKYGALGVLDDEGRYIDQFITSGLTPAVRARMGEPPRGHGLLGAVIKGGQTIRIPDIAQDERSVGFPPNHPPMHSLLGMPIRWKSEIVGDLYLTDKMDAHGQTAGVVFTELDQQLLEMFATQAAIAIENAQLYRRTQQLAILQERQRFGMNLHDGIIQSIYAIGLMLEESAHIIDSTPQETKTLLQQSLRGLNDVIRDIRNYILDLRPQRFQGRNFHSGLQELARDLRAQSILTIHLHADGADVDGLTNEQTVELLHLAQEALTNVSKHARATRVDVTLGNVDGTLVLTIADNGIGFDPARAAKGAGHGLRNMRERARALGGELEIQPREQGGTCLTLEVQLPKQA
jgi:signal transduction histidine kinase